MKTLNIELHYFTNDIPTITNTHVYKIMDGVKEFELFPQVFQEAVPGGSIEQRYMFTNGVSGLTIRCQRDRVILVQAANPNSPDSELTNLSRTLKKLGEIIYKFILTLNQVFEKEHQSYRLAIVTRHIELEKHKELYLKLEKSTTQELPWINSPTRELTLRTGQKFNAEGEEFNSIITINDGLMDVVNSNGISMSASACLLFELDINTTPENSRERFNAESYSKYYNVLSQNQIDTLENMQGYIDKE